MKFQLKNIVTVMALSLVFTSCSKDDDAINGEGAIGLEFDNVFGAANLTLNTQTNTTSQSENLKISDVKYIVSNIVLIKEDGSTYTYPKSQSCFIVDESDVESHTIDLTNIPAGNYTKVKFGIGVDQTQFNLGATGQGDFLTKAQNAGMILTWADGYKFVHFEGMFTSPTVTSDKGFVVNTRQTGTAYNYTEITLDFPDKATVRATVTPEVHIFADVAKIIDGDNKVKLSDNITGGMEAIINDGINLSLITQNLSGMFTVNHVHND